MKKICNTSNYECECPIFDVHDKIEESFYFLVEMIENYHLPCVFRYNLNAFIQSLRSVTFLIQANKSKIPDFDNWYSCKQIDMKNNDLLSKFSNARTYIVHKGMLKTNSKIYFGLFRGRGIKFSFKFDVDPFANSWIELGALIKSLKEHNVDFVGNHSALDEQYGLQREWIVKDISKNEIVSVYYKAYLEIVDIVYELHEKLGYEFVPSCLSETAISDAQVILESDINPSLPQKWGWVD